MDQPTHLPTEEPQPRRMWALWMLFFFQYAAIGVYFTYLNVYFLDAGLSGTQIGLLNMTTALLGVGGAVVWGYLSDRTGKPRLLIAVGAVGSLLAAQFIPFVSGFWGFLVFSGLGSLMNSAPGTLVDSTALSLLGKRREEYGRFRLGGSFGYIATALTAGFIFQQTGLRLMFPAYGIVMSCFAITAILLPPVKTHLQSSGSREIGQMIRQPAWLLFIACIFLCWIGVNASIMFLGVSLSSMGANQSMIGIVSTVPAFCEIPFMFFSGYFLRRFGVVRLLTASMVISMVRFFLLGWMPSPEWAIAINILNGPGFVFFWNSAVNYAYQMAPPGMAGTAQGLLVSTISLAGVVSSLLTGWLFDVVGPKGVFVVMGLLVMAALILFTIGGRIQRPVQQPVTVSDPDLTP